MARTSSVDELGMIGRVSYAIAVTEEPWTLDIDAIVLSVGNGLGDLAGDVLNVYPQARWRSVEQGELYSNLVSAWLRTTWSFVVASASRAF